MQSPCPPLGPWRGVCSPSDEQSHLVTGGSILGPLGRWGRPPPGRGLGETAQSRAAGNSIYMARRGAQSPWKPENCHRGQREAQEETPGERTGGEVGCAYENQTEALDGKSVGEWGGIGCPETLSSDSDGALPVESQWQGAHISLLSRADFQYWNGVHLAPSQRGVAAVVPLGCPHRHGRRMFCQMCPDGWPDFHTLLTDRGTVHSGKTGHPGGPAERWPRGCALRPGTSGRAFHLQKAGEGTQPRWITDPNEYALSHGTRGVKGNQASATDLGRDPGPLLVQPLRRWRGRRAV
ncbi:hypothetical protein Cadr_000007687 [Camelus dromedarius]|uniref:Uncharacterized protein n=1 Tax=Camelus dromedarius TaxID=9838 RepID=A0A5N4DXV4_CAMDR|nr:hypothetical protein Cadr_000007687 [Camelus dromedarius]